MKAAEAFELFTHRINIYCLVFSITAFAAYLVCPKFYLLYGPSKLVYVATIAQCVFSVSTLGFPASYVPVLSCCIWSLIVRGLQVLMPAMTISYKRTKRAS